MKDYTDEEQAALREQALLEREEYRKHLRGEPSAWTDRNYARRMRPGDRS